MVDRDAGYIGLVKREWLFRNGSFYVMLDSSFVGGILLVLQIRYLD
jgi:hypothetical protein